MVSRKVVKGEKIRVNMQVVKSHCNLEPYLKLVKKSMHNGIAIVQGVNEESSTVDIGNLLGGVWIPYEAVKFI